MKVLHLIGGGDTGGARTHLYSLLCGLNEHITADLISFREGDFAEGARACGIPTRVLAGNNIPAVKKTLLRYVREGGYDILHCHGSRANMMGALLRREAGIPVVSTVHSDYKLDYLGRRMGALLFGNINRIALKHVDYRIGVSDAMVDLLIERGFPPERFYTIYNGLDFTPSAETESRADYCHARQIPFAEGDVTVGIAARLDPVKDVATLVRGFALAYEKMPQLRLLIAGDGAEREKLAALAEELGVKTRVTFLGQVKAEDMTRFYRALDINTLTSLSETFPYALTEGAREHCATVASRVGGIPSLIDDGSNGFLFPAGDAEALARHLITLAGDADLRRRMGDALYRKASEKFSVSATVRTQLSIYEDILRREKREKKTRDGVLICGAYGKGNGGDDAILHAIVNEMHGIDPYLPITVLSRDPSATRVHYRVDAIHTFAFPAWLRRMRKTKLYINGGGNLIQDVTSSRSLWYYLCNIAAAKRCGNRVLMYGCGIGPVKETHRPRVAATLNRFVDVITLREPDSLAELRRIGVTKPEIELTADPALALPPAEDALTDGAFAAAGIAPGTPCFGISLRVWDGFKEKAHLFGALADYVYERYGLTPVFFSVENRQDPYAARLAAEHCHVPHCFLEATEDTARTIGLLSRMSAVLSMRLHTLIFAAGRGTPLIGVVYDPKVSSFLRYIGEDRFLSLADVTEEDLRRLADDALASAKTREERSETVARLRALAGRNAVRAEELLGADL